VRHEIDGADARVPQELVGDVPTVLPTRRRIVALTFDAGANDAGLPKIAATLRRLRVPATFFMTGHFARFYPGWARFVAARYPIGNHTMNHVDLNGLSDAQVRREVVDGAEAIRRVTGRSPQQLFRFPYGSESARTLGIVNALGYAAQLDGRYRRLAGKERRPVRLGRRRPCVEGTPTGRDHPDARRLEPR